MIWLRRLSLALLGRFGARLRFPHLLLLTGALFVFDLVLPDALPFLDEILLGLLAMLFAIWKKRDGVGSGDPAVPREVPSDGRSVERDRAR